MSVVIDPNQVGGRQACPYCHKQLAHKSSVDRHLKEGSCKVKDPSETKKNLLKFKREQEKRDLERLDQEKHIINQGAQVLSQEAIIQGVSEALKGQMKEVVIETIKEMGHDRSLVPIGHSMINNQILNQNHSLNILCLGKNDNILDMLSSAEGIVNALTYMKDCVLAQLAGDCRILQKAYRLDTAQAAIMYVNKSKTKYCYYDERRRLTVEANAAVMAKKLAGILQRSYLKGMEGFKTNILGEQREGLNIDKMPELEAYDIHLWNEHVQRLSDEKYQKKVLKSLKIPMAPPEG